MNATESNVNESVSGAEGTVSRTPEGLILEEITNTVTQLTVEDILQRLKAFAQGLKQPTRSSAEQTAALPTVGIIGMGRCGTNIAIDLANLVYEQRKIGIKELSRRARNTTKRPSPTEKTSESGQSGSANGKAGTPSFWKRLFGEKSDRDQVFLVDPVILTADLDGDTTQRIKVANPTLTQGALRFGITELDWLNRGGAGNIPVVGQYLATLALLAEAKPETPWARHRSYLVDSSGLAANASRLFFYLFSAGGGSGSGMAPLFGRAQQQARMVNVKRQRPTGQSTREYTEALCSVGVTILPDILRTAHSQHYNAGRLLCEYLASLNRFEQSFDPATGMPLPTFSCLLLVSNTVVHHALGERFSSEIYAVKAEQLANKYVARQLFNLLTAQALVEDYRITDPKVIPAMNAAGISLDDTTKLDINDLENSLSGTAVIGYAEQFAHEDFGQLFLRSVSPASYNSDNEVFEGISLLPDKFEEYQATIEACRKNNSIEQLRDYALFGKALSVVAIVSAPRSELFEQYNLRKVHENIESLFPNATIKRYALILGASENCSLTLIISGSACLVPDALFAIRNYIFGCFVADNRHQERFTQLFNQIMSNPVFEPGELAAMMRDKESLDPIIVGMGSQGAWRRRKQELELRAQSLNPRSVANSAPPVVVEDVLLSKQEVIDALEYIHRVNSFHRPVTV
ncbi:MAG TPA: hypothetical protein VE641_17620 [Chthoniobacterales bacterium]|jgi:hypothetical protein|nr:hypothetical protein [Chthoniobacterales bacterium]